MLEGGVARVASVSWGGCPSALVRDGKLARLFSLIHSLSLSPSPHPPSHSVSSSGRKREERTAVVVFPSNVAAPRPCE